MLGTHIIDTVESDAGHVAGLGLLPVQTTFSLTKVLARPARTLRDGSVVDGYEIHHGLVDRDGGETFFADEGCRVGSVTGTIWHGLLENDSFRRAYLRDIARLSGRKFTAAADVSFAAIREARLSRLADLIADHLDTGVVRALLASGPTDLPELRLSLRNR
jgi:adenosylcobyric acid synthase